MEQGWELGDVGLEGLGRNDRVFHERHGFAWTRSVSQETNPLLAEVPQAFALVRIPRQRLAMWDPRRTCAPRNLGQQALHFGLHAVFVVAAVLDQVDAGRGISAAVDYAV